MSIKRIPGVTMVAQLYTLLTDEVAIS